MTLPNVLWLSVSPSLRCFDQRLLARLTKVATVRRWEYCQTVDEPCCIQSMVTALHEYVSDRAALETSFGNIPSQIHLAGHGVSGIVALIYAQRFPDQIASLTLLSVAAKPAINWQAHYYALRQLLPCSREMILAQMTRLLFGQQPARFTKALSQLLAHDLDSNLTLHSLAHHTQVAAGQVAMPLLVCNGQIDAVVGALNDAHWQAWQRDRRSDFRLWHCPEGNHFFHFYHAKAVAETMSAHWHNSIQASETIASPLQAVSSHPAQLVQGY